MLLAIGVGMRRKRSLLFLAIGVAVGYSLRPAEPPHLKIGPYPGSPPLKAGS